MSADGDCPPGAPLLLWRAGLPERSSREAAMPWRPLLQIHSYSGHKADERPERFEWLGVELRIEAILDRWYGPDYAYFKVRASDGGLYLLRHDERQDLWEIHSRADA